MELRTVAPARAPMPRPEAWAAVGRCIGTSAGMLARRQVAFPVTELGRRITFADHSTSRVYRDTTVARPATEPCFLAVSFRLRRVRGRAHAWFRAESLLNTPLFVGFPGFTSKLWLAHDEHGRYRGLYEWDGPDRAEQYARSLWHVLALVSEPRSIDYRVVPGLRRADILADPGVLGPWFPGEEAAWWRVVAVT
ncbi:hypothetical protein GCM10009740_01880 [Terrabacter terrae]|uniref:DUF2071 domain-containing protein n=1 Tax=Terrabacter terrae TaxID=318434 RepID=A0ABN2TRD8_9MICO